MTAQKAALSDDSLMRELARLGSLIDRVVCREELPKSVPFALVILANHEVAMADGLAPRPLTQAGLAQVLGIRPQSVGPLLAKLEKAGLVSRERRADDRRAVEVLLTEAGRERVRETRERDCERAREVLSVLDDDEKRVFGSAVIKLSASLEERERAAEGPRR